MKRNIERFGELLVLVGKMFHEKITPIQIVNHFLENENRKIKSILNGIFLTTFDIETILYICRNTHYVDGSIYIYNEEK